MEKYLHVRALLSSRAVQTLLYHRYNNNNNTINGHIDDIMRFVCNVQQAIVRGLLFLFFGNRSCSRFVESNTHNTYYVYT